MPVDRYPLEPPREVRERWLARIGAFLQDYLDGVARTPAGGRVDDAMAVAARVRLPISEEPVGLEPALDTLARSAEAALNTPGPGYLAYVPGGGLYASALAELLAAAMNRYTGVAGAAPALVQLEADVLAWLARELGYPPEARGLLTSGGSLANFGAVVAARHALLGESGDLRRAMVYCSSQVHHSVLKAVRLAGIPAANVRAVAVDGRLRLDPEALRRAVRSDADRQPFLVVASAGTTNTGAIDPLGPLAELCGELGLWLHVDAAYGGAWALCDEGRRRLQGIERADSIAFDPHKGLFLPYGTGCLLVRDGERLRAAHALGADYLQDFGPGPMPPSPSDYGPELSRPFRGLHLWLPLMLHGARVFREALSEKLELAEWLWEELVARGLDVVDRPQLTTLAFRLPRAAGEDLDAWNARNAQLMARINEAGRVWLSSTTLPVADGLAYTVRVCIVSFRTHRDRLEAFLEDLDSG